MPTALIAGGIAGLGSIVGGVIGSKGAEKAAQIQAQSAQNALDFQKSVYQQNQAIFDKNSASLSPFINAGTNATGQLTKLNSGNFSAFKLSPDFQFAQAQGTRGLQNYENANGLALSGGALKDVAEFNSGLATQNYGNYYNRLLQLSQIGGNAAGSLVGASGGLINANTGFANTIGNTTQGLGQAQASGVVGSANAINGAIGGGVNNSLLAYKLFGGGGGTGTNTTSAYGNPLAQGQ